MSTFFVILLWVIFKWFIFGHLWTICFLNINFTLCSCTVNQNQVHTRTKSVKCSWFGNLLPQVNMLNGELVLLIYIVMLWKINFVRNKIIIFGWMQRVSFIGMTVVALYGVKAREAWNYLKILRCHSNLHQYHCNQQK